MNKKEALQYAARILRADQQYAYYEDVDHTESIEMLEYIAAEDHRLESLEATITFNEENEEKT